MEQIAPGAIADIVKLGTGWALFILACLVIRWQNSTILDLTQKVTEALTRTTEQNKELLTVQRERVLAEKDTASAMQVLASRVDSSTEAAKERADDIKRFIAKDRES